MAKNYRAFVGVSQLSNIRFLDGKASGLLNGVRIKAERVVIFKSNPSRHECDARCMGASGKSMQCECTCGGANHGRGSFVCEAA